MENLKLTDHLGLAAMKLDKKLLKLVGDTDVIAFDSVWEMNNSIEDMIVIADNVSLEATFDHVQKYSMNYLVQQQDENTTYNLLMTSIISRYPDAFLKSPLPTILRSTNSGDTNWVSIPFQSSRQKRQIMVETRNFLKIHPRLASLEANVNLIINELMMNALYCAPVDSNGHYLYRDSDRSNEVQYPDNKKAEITLSFNEKLLVIGCRDPYGSVDKSHVTGRLHEVFRKGQKIRIKNQGTTQGGSGLGLKMVIEGSSGFGMVVKKDTETFVYAILPLGKGQRAISRMPKNLALKFY